MIVQIVGRLSGGCRKVQQDYQTALDSLRVALIGGNLFWFSRNDFLHTTFAVITVSRERMGGET